MRNSRWLRLLAVLAAFLTFALLGNGPAFAITTNLEHGWAGFEFYPPSDNSWEGIAEWVTVPTVTNQCNTSNQLAVWVGLGGAGNPEFPFTQNGLSLTQSNSITSAWWEIFHPDGSTTVGTVPFSASPGDQVLLREIWGVNHGSLWMVWTNETTNAPAVVKRFDDATLWARGRRGVFINEDVNFLNGQSGAAIPWTGRINFSDARMEQNDGPSNTYGADGTPRPTSTTAVNNADELENMSRTVPHTGQVRMNAYRSGTDNRSWFSVQDYCQ